MRHARLAVLLVIALTVLGGCTRHTYYMELINGEYFYAEPPLVMDTKTGTYQVGVNGVRRTIAMDDVRTISDTAQICYKNTDTDTFTCYDALYQY